MWAFLLGILFFNLGLFIGNAVFCVLAANLFFSIPASLKLYYMGVFDSLLPFRGYLIGLFISLVVPTIIINLAYLMPKVYFFAFLLGMIISIIFVKWQNLIGNGLFDKLYRDNQLSIPVEIDSQICSLAQMDNMSPGTVLAFSTKYLQLPFLKPTNPLPIILYAPIFLLGLLETIILSFRAAFKAYVIVGFLGLFLMLVTIWLDTQVIKLLEPANAQLQPHNWCIIMIQMILSPWLWMSIVFVFFISPFYFGMRNLIESLRWNVMYEQMPSI